MLVVFLPINVEKPTIVGISTFMARKKISTELSIEIVLQPRGQVTQIIYK